MTCNHFAVIYKSKVESLFTSLPPFIIIEDLRIYRVFFTHSIHDIRHSHTSYLINLGCAPLLISERLGHEKVQTTLNTYSHLYPNKHQEVVDMIQNQHKKDMATSDVTAPVEASEKSKPQGTRFKVVSPKDNTSPQQVHENDLSPCVGFTGRT